MGGELRSVLYVSSATSYFSSEQLAAFLRSWRTHNQEWQITGFLLYHDGNFIQVIEGPSAAIEELVAAIAQDSRHRGMLILWDRTIEEREFAEWCMGFRDGSNLTPEDRDAFSTLLLDSGQEERFRQNGGVAHQMLLQFKAVCARDYS